MLIPFMIDSYRVKLGEATNNQQMLAVIEKARAALPLVMKGAELMRIFLEKEGLDHYNLGYGQQLINLDRALSGCTRRLQGKLAVSSPYGSKDSLDPLRFLVTMLDIYSNIDLSTDERARTHDIAVLAEWLFETHVTDKMVTLLRSK
jgi:hypothetical protein